MTVIRSFGNDRRHLGVLCWTQTGRTGKVSANFGCHSVVSIQLSVYADIVNLFKLFHLHVRRTH